MTLNFDIHTTNEFITPIFKNADGTPQRWRRNGATKTWKTRPDDFRIPIKRGLNEYAYITPSNAHEFQAQGANQS